MTFSEVSEEDYTVPGGSVAASLSDHGYVVAPSPTYSLEAVHRLPDGTPVLDVHGVTWWMFTTPLGKRFLDTGSRAVFITEATEKTYGPFRPVR